MFSPLLGLLEQYIRENMTNTTGELQIQDVEAALNKIIDARVMAALEAASTDGSTAQTGDSGSQSAHWYNHSQWQADKAENDAATSAVTAPAAASDVINDKS